MTTEREGTAMADGERQGAPGQAAESPEVAALLAKLASVTSAIHATWADGGMAAGDTLIRWRDRLAQCSEAAAVLGWRADADHAALAGAQRRHSLLELDRDERAKAYHAAEGAFTETSGWKLPPEGGRGKPGAPQAHHAGSE